MAELNAQEITLSGTELTFVAADTEDTFKNSGNRTLFLKNTEAINNEACSTATWRFSWSK